MVTCAVCAGTGWVFDSPCHACNGVGRVPVPSRIGNDRAFTKADWISAAIAMALFAALVIWLLLKK